MSFLKEFKDDLTQAVNELVAEPGQETEKKDEVIAQDDEMINTLDDSLIAGIDLDTIGDMLEEESDSKTENVKNKESVKVEEVETAKEPEAVPEPIVTPIIEAQKEPAVTSDEEVSLPSDELTEITRGTSIKGDIASEGSISVFGKVVGNIDCKGKLVISGMVEGTSEAGEVFANTAKINGDIKSKGAIKVGNGTVIVGNIYGTSAVVGGAIKGDIDVHGPVIVDATAVIQGNIKSRSVQINNGAVIDGFCSQCYADVDYKSLFEDTFAK